MAIQKQFIYKKQSILIIICIMIITICAITLGFFHYRTIKEQHHITHIKITRYLTKIRHQDKSFLTSVKYNKRNSTIYWHLSKHTCINAQYSYPLYLRNILLNREAKFNKYPAITNNFSVIQSQELSHFNDSLATIKYQSTILNHIHRIHTITNNNKINRALFINRHINTECHVSLSKKKRAKKVLSTILNHSLFSKHIKMSKSSDLLLISVPKSIRKATLNKQKNFGYALRVQIYQTILQDTYYIQARIKNPFLVIRVTNIKPFH